MDKIKIALKSKGVINIPCKRCGKPFKNDYSGLCMDCAEELGISEVFKVTPEETAKAIKDDTKITK